MQIANYGIGGLYKTHTDNVIHPEVRQEDQDPWNLHVGDRIATLMVYVSCLPTSLERANFYTLILVPS